MSRRLSTKTRMFDLDEASVYLAAHLSDLDDEQTCRLAEAVGRAKSTVQSWAAGRSVPARNLWPRIGQFFGEGPGAMFDAASRKLVPPVKSFPHQIRQPTDEAVTRDATDIAQDAELVDLRGEVAQTLQRELAVLRARIARLEETSQNPSP
jgi:hypothetical protein